MDQPTKTETIENFVKNFVSIETRRSYKKALECFFEFLEKHKIPSDLSGITVPTLIGYRTYLELDGKSDNTIYHRISVVKSLLDWCCLNGFLSNNPASKVKLKRPSPKKPTMAFKDSEVASILENLSSDSYRKCLHKTILTFLFNLGLRRSELINIKISDIYDDRNHTVIEIKGKGNKTRALPLNEFTKNQLNDFLNFREIDNKDRVLFSKTKKGKDPLDPSSIYKIVRSYAKKAGISRRIGVHSCRATVISHLLDTQKVQIRDVADFAGHSDIRTTSLYDKKRRGLDDSASYRIKYGIAS